MHPSSGGGETEIEMEKMRWKKLKIKKEKEKEKEKKKEKENYRGLTLGVKYIVTKRYIKDLIDLTGVICIFKHPQNRTFKLTWSTQAPIVSVERTPTQQPQQFLKV
uniref:Uncharacterized protein n=1 Tax=Glossina brevipalpis TaxID=37001 RepID=A0A1A9WPZ8_9MUSC